MYLEKIEHITIPRYLTIAVDIATRIASGSILEGEKLKGRSILSTEYNVSPETIRRSMSLLSDKKVVRINASSGTINTYQRIRYRFIKNFKFVEVL